jgi:hypothetical protein
MLCEKLLSGVAALVVATTLTTLSGCGGGDQAAGESALTRLGLDEPDAQRYTTEKLLFGNFAYYAVSQSFKALDDDARAEVIEGAASWARTYLESDAFAEQYVKMRDEAEPTPPEFTGSIEDELERTLDKQRVDYEESRKGLASLPRETRDALEESMEATMKLMNEPQMIEMQKQGIAQDRAYRQASYEEAHARWEKDYPEDVSGLIELRLREFLDTTKDMDFDADLVERNGRQVFEDPELEAKPSEWKVYFRAGEEAVTAARDAATEWLEDVD